MKQNKLTLDDIEIWRVYYHRRALDGFRDGLDMTEAYNKLDFATFFDELYRLMAIKDKFAELDKQRKHYLIYGTLNVEKNAPPRTRKR